MDRCVSLDALAEQTHTVTGVKRELVMWRIDFCRACDDKSMRAVLRPDSTRRAGEKLCKQVAVYFSCNKHEGFLKDVETNSYKSV